MTSPVVFGINSSAARGLNVPGTAALTEPDSLAGPVERPEWVVSGHLVIRHTDNAARSLRPTSLSASRGSYYCEDPGTKCLGQPPHARLGDRLRTGRPCPVLQMRSDLDSVHPWGGDLVAWRSSSS